MPDSPSEHTTLEQQVASAVEQPQQPDDSNTQPAATSDAGDQGAQPAELSLDQVIKATLEKGKQTADSPSDDGNQGASTEAAKTEEAGKTDPKDEADDDANVPFHKHPRWKQVKSQRDEARKQAAELQKQLEEFEPLRTKASQLDEIGNYMRTNNLTPQEMSEGFEVMALMKNNPAKALELLMPKIELLELASGRRLPDDIRERVDAGRTDEDTAQELAKARILAAERARAAEEANNRLAERSEIDHANELRAAADAKEQEIASKDPDFQHKKRFVIDRFRVLAAEAPPRGKDDVSALIGRAYEDVNTYLRGIVKPQPTQPTVTSGQSTTRTAPQPRSLEDVVRANLNR